MKISLKKKIRNKNEEFAVLLRDDFSKNGVFTVNIMSSPGSGKTTLLEKTLETLSGELRMGVIVGDPQTSKDTERLLKTGIQAEQINTGHGCHLDARMVSLAVEKFNLSLLDILFIENVGNLLCPADFDLGEDVRVVLMSVPEGDEKPIKYPPMFADANLVLLNKMDMIEYTNFNRERFQKNIAAVNERLAILPISCMTGEGLPGWYDWLKRRLREKRCGCE